MATTNSSTSSMRSAGGSSSTAIVSSASAMTTSSSSSSVSKTVTYSCSTDSQSQATTFTSLIALEKGGLTTTCIRVNSTEDPDEDENEISALFVGNQHGDHEQDGLHTPPPTEEELTACGAKIRRPCNTSYSQQVTKQSSTSSSVTMTSAGSGTQTSSATVIEEKKSKTKKVAKRTESNSVVQEERKELTKEASMVAQVQQNSVNNAISSNATKSQSVSKSSSIESASTIANQKNQSQIQSQSITQNGTSAIANNTNETKLSQSQEEISQPPQPQLQVEDNRKISKKRRSFSSLININIEPVPKPRPRSVNSNGSGGVLTNIDKSFSKFDRLAKKSPTMETPNCAACGSQVFLVEIVKADKASWHKNCFRCTECRKQLTVDSYASHEGQLYCKPHHRNLLMPKPSSFNEEEVEQEQPRNNNKVEVENVPVELPPDVVRATDPVHDPSLEELENLDLRSRFEVFEKKNNAEEQMPLDKVQVKRSPSVLAKLTKFENGTGQKGVELNGDYEESEEDETTENGEKKIKNPLEAMKEVIQAKELAQVRAKWENPLSREEEMKEERRSEMMRFRSRLCQGKSSNLKSLYESGAFEQGQNCTDNKKLYSAEELAQIEEERKAGRLKDLFEAGQVKGEDDVEGRIGMAEKIDLELAKASREVFKRLEQNGVDEHKLDGARDGEDNQVIRAAVGQKSKFFEQMADGSGDQGSRKTRGLTTPERELLELRKQRQENGVVDEPDAEADIYFDPSIVRPSSGPDDSHQVLSKSRTTSRMLSMFRQLETESGQDKPKAVAPPRALKEFTPERETKRVYTEQDSDQEGREREESVSDEEGGETINKDGERDDFLKQVGSLARARNLRARFERWENDAPEAEVIATSPIELESTIESARVLKEKFERLQEEEEEAKKKKKTRNIRRFVASPLDGGDENCCDSLILSSNSSSASSTSSSTTPAFCSLPVGGGTGLIIMSDAPDACGNCSKRVYPMEKVEANNKLFHKMCFRCSVCKSVLRMNNFTFHHGELYCTNHFKQLFKIKGNYDEGFGFETQKQIFAKKQAAEANK